MEAIYAYQCKIEPSNIQLSKKKKKIPYKTYILEDQNNI